MGGKRRKCERKDEPAGRDAAASTSSSLRQDDAVRRTKRKVSSEEDSTQGSRTPPPGDAPPPSTADVSLMWEQIYVLKMAAKRRNVFFTGPAGTGKSLLLRRIVQHFREEMELEAPSLVVTATTGLAAKDIGGCTIHSWAGVGTNKDKPVEALLERMLPHRIYRSMQRERESGIGSYLIPQSVDSMPSCMQRWVQCKVLILDEVSMLDAEFFDKLEYIARFMRRNDEPFGGIQLIFTGDFLQLPPISRSTVTGEPKFAFQSESWDLCFKISIRLEYIHRQKDFEFIDVLDDIQHGDLTSRARAFMLSHREEVEYPTGLHPVYLYGTNKEVESRNRAELDKMPGHPRTYEAVDDFPSNYDPFTVPHDLKLKVGARVMLHKNLVPSVLVNGSMGEVIGFGTPAKVYRKKRVTIGVPYALAELTVPGTSRYAYQCNEQELQDWLKDEGTYPIVRFTYGTSRIRSVDILCVPLEFTAPHPDGELRRKQVPLSLAYALTIHKAQGQSFERVCVDMMNIWDFGQCYTALSRAINPDHLQIINFFRPWNVKAHPAAVAWYDTLGTAPEPKSRKRPRLESDGLTRTMY